MVIVVTLSCADAVRVESMALACGGLVANQIDHLGVGGDALMTCWPGAHFMMN